MTDKRISELTELTTATASDILAIVNASETKKITATNFINSAIPLEAVLFDTGAATPPTTEGIVFYSLGDHTLSLRTERSDVTLQIGQELHVRVKNVSGGDIDNGEAVYITGISGGLPTIDLAQADDTATSTVLGLATSDILDTEEGRITIFGLVRDLNTAGFAAGADVFLSAVTPGALVDTAPVAPNTISLLGQVLVSDGSAGIILINAIVNSSVLDQRYATKSTKSWAFGSPSGTSGTFYTGGYYIFGGSSNDFDPSINFGTANSSYAAHVMFVVGAVTVDELTLRVTGTSITDAGVRSAADTEDVVIPDATAADAYFETAKKWLGQVSIEVVSGTPKICNYGFCKYWDNNNTDMTLLGVEATWLAGATDATPNLSIIHHKATGWTYGVGGTPTPPYVVRMNTDHVTEIQTINGEHGAWKRDNLSTVIDGNDSEGIVIEVFTSANKTFDVDTNINITISPA
jgi:hypothetical protein